MTRPATFSGLNTSSPFYSVLDYVWVFDDGLARPTQAIDEVVSAAIDMTYGTLGGETSGGMLMANNGQNVLNTYGTVNATLSGNTILFALELDYNTQSYFQTITDQAVSNNDPLISVQINADGSLKVDVQTGSSHEARLTIPNGAYTVGEKLNLVVYADLPNQNIYWCINGAVVASIDSGVITGAATINGSPWNRSFNGTTSFYLGRATPWSSYYGYDGTIGLLSINTSVGVLAKADVQTLSSDVYALMASGATGVTGNAVFDITKPTFSIAGSATVPSPTGDIAFDITKPRFSASGAATLPQAIGNISYSIDRPTFSSSGSATLPQPIGDIAYTINAPTFSVSGSATLPNPTGNAVFDISKPLFSGEGSATTPNPIGNIDITITKPSFSGQGQATLPQPTGNIDFAINAPVFSGQGAAIGFEPIGNIVFDISSPTFSASGSATLPQPVGNASFTIDKPIFDILGSQSGVVISYSPDAIITVNSGQNIIIVTND